MTRYLASQLPVFRLKIAKNAFGDEICSQNSTLKGYFGNSGLACYLHSINSPLALTSNPRVGALFETWVFNMIDQQAAIARPISMYHWRSNGGAEVDILLSQNGILYPIEVKMSSTLSAHDTRGIRAFHETYPHKNIAHGLAIYGGDRCYRINEYATALPWNAYLR